MYVLRITSKLASLMKFKADLIRCGNNLRKLREEQRMSVGMLAALSGVDEETIIQFEQGEGGDVAIVDLLQITEVLDVTLSAVLAGSNLG